MTLEQRAAKYFGVHDEPRASVKVDRLSCYLVLRRQRGGVAIAYYSESNPSLIKADYHWLPEAKRKALVEALDG